MKHSFFTRRSLLILMVLAFSLSFIFMGTRRALRSNRNDVKTWLPDGFQETLDHAWFESHFPHEQFILMSWDNCKLGDPSLEMMAEKMRLLTKQPFKKGQPVFFKNVITAEGLIEEIQSSFKSLDHQEIIDRLKGSLVGPDGKQTCLVVTLREAYHGEELAAAINAVKETATDQCGISPQSLHLGGPPVDNAAIDYEGKRTLMRLAGWSAVIGLGISWLCFRSVRLTLMIFSCALFSAGIGMAIVYFTGGMVDAILLSMPSLVYVLAMSGAIHIINYYHDAVRESGLEHAPEKGLSHGWVPCTVAAITTALGLISLCYSNLIPIRNFGLYSALGVLASLAVIFLVLPAYLHFWPSRKLAEEMGHGGGTAAPATGDTVFLKVWRIIGGNVIRHNKLVATACFLAMFFFAYGAYTKTNTTISLMKLFSPEARILADYAWLEHHLGPLVPLEVVVRLDDEKCDLDLAQRMRLASTIEESLEFELNEVGEALSAATFAPLKDMNGKIGKRNVIQRNGDNVFSNRVNQNRERFRDYLSIDEEKGEELWRISARVEALGDIDYGAFMDHLKAVVDPIIEDYNAHGVEGISVTYTGLVPLIYKAQSELLVGLFNSLLLAFVLIALVMMMVLRSFSAGLLSMLPNLFPVIVIFGAMAWVGMLIDVGTMMTASVALGVAVDDTVHYLTWFRAGLDQGYDRKGAAMVAYERCATAMTQTTLIAGLGLAVFALSTFTPTQRFGYMMLALLFAALFGDLIFLPALLCGPLGRFFDRGSSKRSHDHLPPSNDNRRGLPIEGGKHSPPKRYRYDSESEVARDAQSVENLAESPHTLPIRPKRVPRSRV
ncbi:MAG: MMPL family transporter [Pirellulales bacterium]|nr:MMPL family transporter [Pirellulales bacterium]